MKLFKKVLAVTTLLTLAFSAVPASAATDVIDFEDGNTAEITNKYVKVDNDIDVLLEYSDGSAPTLVLNSFVDGNNKVVSRWYNTGNKYLINTNQTTNKYIENFTFTNIKTNYTLIYNTTLTRDLKTIRNCKFAGIMGDGYVIYGSSSVYSGVIDGLVVNIKGNDLHLLHDYTTNDHWNCNIKLETSATWINSIYAGDRDQIWHDSFFDITAPNLTAMKSGSGRSSYNNCVLDIKSNGELTFDTRNTMVSIFNSTNAPNATGTADKMVGVDATHWLDADYLADTVGFNIVESE